MTSDQQTLVVDSWKALPISGKDFAARSYRQLFSAHPQLRILFEGFEDDQHERLAKTLDHAVQALHDLGSLEPVLKELGRRHRDYGVKDHHYAAVGEAILNTLADVLGPAFTPEAREAWAVFYGALASAMQGPQH